MCKLLAIISKNNNSKLSKKQLFNVLKILGKGQNDGIGYYIESTNKSKTFKKGFDTSVMLNNNFKCTNNTLLSDDFEASTTIYNNYKHSTDNFKFLLAHTRTSTNEISILATQPFLHKQNIFAHNGVVNIPTHKYDTKSNNDSEYLMHYFLENENYNDIDGYLATLNYNIKNQTLTISRDNRATLYFIENNDYIVITTKKEDAASIINILQSEKNKIKLKAYLITDNTIQSLNINKLKVKSTKLIKKDKVQIDKNLITKSLGNSNNIQDDTDYYYYSASNFDESKFYNLK